MAERFADYELITLLAESLTGRVWLAQKIDDDNLLVVKEMLLEQEGALSEAEQTARFEREIRLHSVLDHPSIVKAIGGGTWEGRHYLVCQHQPGLTLHALIEQGLPPVPQVLEWGLQLCSALEYLYDRFQLVHRDIKPANLIVDPSGRIMMTDFGLARIALHPEITQTKMMLGTIAYMSAEQLLDPTLVDNRADLFSVGVVLYKCLTGTLPFHADDVAGMAHRLLYDAPTDPREHRADLPESLAKLLLRCLSKDTESRYTSAQQLAADLRAELARPELHLAHAEDLMARGAWAEAALSLQHVLAQDPARTEAWFDLGQAKMALGQDSAALDCFLKVVSAQPSHVGAYRQLGALYQKRGDARSLEAAARMLERAWTLEPTDLATCLELLASRTRSGQYAEALELAEIILTRHPDETRAQLERGRILARMGDRDGAIGAFRAVLSTAPGQPDALYILGTLYLQARHWAEAERLLLAALDHESTREGAMQNLAVVYLEEGRPVDAEAVLEELLALRPTAAAWSLMGMARMARRQPLEAIEPFTRAYALGAEHAHALQLSEALVASYRFREALQVLRDLVPTTPADELAPLWLRIAQLEASSGLRAEAVLSLTQCIEAGATGMVRLEADNRLKALQPQRSPRVTAPAGVARMLERALPWAR
ncbi:MAG: tetratricopeptide repeat protein [Candidatus Sericytochromatia bacterium]|nr:tetratricopeptide repeat protein [Candidatus Sericytochromatia bacterium]